jgi:hypothetical protein
VQDFDVISIVMNSGTYLKLNAIMENERKVFLCWNVRWARQFKFLKFGKMFNCLFLRVNPLHVLWNWALFLALFLFLLCEGKPLSPIECNTNFVISERRKQNLLPEIAYETLNYMCKLMTCPTELLNIGCQLLQFITKLTFLGPKAILPFINFNS